MSVVGQIAIALGMRMQDFEKGIDKAKKDVGGLDTSLGSKIGGALDARGLGSLVEAAPAIGATGAALAAATVVAGKFALEFEKVQASVRKSQVIFGDQAKTVDEFATRMSTSYGVVKSEVRDAASAIGASFKNSGADQGKAAEFGTKLTEIGMNLAAFAGRSPEEAFSAIGAALRGEYDSLEQFQLGLKATTVEAKAVEMGLASAGGEVSDLAKKMATAQLITEQSRDAMGSLDATSMTLGAELSKTKSMVGELIVSMGSWAKGPLWSATRRFNELTAAVFGFTTAAKQAEAYIPTVEDKLAAGDARIKSATDALRGKVQAGVDARQKKIAEEQLKSQQNVIQSADQNISSLQDQVGTALVGSAEAWGLYKMKVDGATEAQVQMYAGLLKAKIGLDQQAHAAEKAKEQVKALADFNQQHWGMADAAQAGSQEALTAVARAMGGGPPQAPQEDPVQAEQLSELRSITTALQRANEYLATAAGRPKVATVGRS